MKLIRNLIAGVTGLLAFVGGSALAEQANALVGVQGYDLVSYHNSGPKRGSGHHRYAYKGVNYLFASEANQKKFAKNPERYLPAYGGYCAYGVSVGKKFMVDPLAWRIVDGMLYLNLDQDVQRIWERDITGNISMADDKWPSLKDVSPDDL